MPRASLTRRVTFAATHSYHRPDWTEAENRRVFGEAAPTHSHGHTYICSLTVGGEMEPVTGFVCDLAALDRIIAEEIVARFAGRNLNIDVREFAAGLAPSCENMARLVFDVVKVRLPAAVRLEGVTIAEDDTLSATYTGGD